MREWERHIIVIVASADDVLAVDTVNTNQVRHEKLHCAANHRSKA